jgi:hypothetical protein
MKKGEIKNSSVFLIILVVGIAFFFALMAALPHSSYSTFNNSYMSFEYPNGWVITQSDNGRVVEVKKDTDYDYYVQVHSNKSSYDTKIYKESGFGEYKGLYSTEKGMEYSVYDEGDTTTYFFIKNNKYYEVSGTTLSLDEMDHVVDTII